MSIPCRGTPRVPSVGTMTPRTASAPAARLPREPMAIPTPRGPVSAAIVAVVTGPIGAPPIVSSLDAQVERAVVNSRDVLTDDDLLLGLLCLHTLGADGVRGVDPRWADDAVLATARRTIEAALLEALDDRRSVPLVAADASDRLARYLAHEASDAEVREFAVIASVCAHGDRATAVDAALAAAGLDLAPGHYVDAVDVRVLAARTTATMLGAGAGAPGSSPLLAEALGAAAERLGAGRLGEGLGDAADSTGRAGASRSSGTRPLADTLRLVEGIVAEHALDCWLHRESALRACDLVETDPVLGTAVVETRELEGAH